MHDTHEPHPALSRWSVSAAVAVAAATIAVGCGTQDRGEPRPTAAIAAEPGAVTISAGEYYFKAPRGMAAGQTLLRLRSVGRETHQLAVARLAPGVSMEEAIKSGGSGGTATPLGEVVAVPGAEAELSVRLTSGDYVLLCFEEEGRLPGWLGHLARERRGIPARSCRDAPLARRARGIRLRRRAWPPSPERAERQSLFSG